MAGVNFGELAHGTRIINKGNGMVNNGKKLTNPPPPPNVLVPGK